MYPTEKTFKCVNNRCRNDSFGPKQLCRFCKDIPHGWSKEEMAPFGDLPFEEMQRIKAIEDKKALRDRALKKHARLVGNQDGARIILPPHFKH